MIKAFIIHGWEGYPQEGWLPWLKNQLIKLGYQAEIPQMPNRIIPVSKDWLKVIRQLPIKSAPHTIFVGHSLGANIILQYLNQSRWESKFKAVVLVAPFVRDIRVEAVLDFVDTKYHWEKIIGLAEKFIIIHSRDDLIVSCAEVQYIARQLKAELIEVDDFQHFSGVDTIKTAMPVLAAIQSVMIK